MSTVDLPGLGRYVHDGRRDLDLRYDDVASRLGKDVAWVYWIEDDVLPAIELDMLVRLAVALEVDQAIMMHQARLPSHPAAGDASRHHGARITERWGQPGRTTEDLRLFSDRHAEEDRRHITQMQREPERPVTEGQEHADG